MLSILLAVPSCFNSVWQGVIPTSYFIFTLVQYNYVVLVLLVETDDIVGEYGEEFVPEADGTELQLTMADGERASRERR